MPVTCKGCGEQNADGTLMCGMCGAVLKSPQSAAPQRPVPSAAGRPTAPPRPGMPPQTVAGQRPIPPTPRPVNRNSTLQFQTPVTYAGFWKRFAAHVIDGIVLSPVGSVFGYFAGKSDNPGMVVLVGILAPCIIAWLYYAGMESSSRQSTFGKGAMDIMVTDMNGEPISFGRATARFFLKIFSAVITLGIGYILAGFTPKKQAVHDMIAGTLVI